MTEDADSVLEQVAQTYSGLESYSDTGRMNTRTNSAANEFMSELTFSTHFRRPNLFRFEWRYSDIDGVNIIWCDGRHAFSKYAHTESKIKREFNLGMVVAGATGVSKGTAHTVSSLLIEEVGGRKLTDLKAPKYKGSEIVHDEACHHLCHMHRGQQIFISKSRSVILRIDYDYTIKSGDAESALKSTRFKSFGLFMYWLRNAGRVRSERSEDQHIVGRTVYEHVLLNPDIPDGVFLQDL